jgi:hypothetical protein
MGIHQSVYFLEYEMNDREIGVQFLAKARVFPLLRPDRFWEISAYRPTGNEEGCGTCNEINQMEDEADYSHSSSVDIKNVPS